jgi:hypothetical protein
MDADDFIGHVLDAQRNNSDSQRSEDGLFLQLLLSPLRKRSDGSFWPFSDKVAGLLWVIEATSEYVEEITFKNYVYWGFITDLRYQFENGDDVAGMELHKLCYNLDLYVPEVVQSWLNEKMGDGLFVTKSQRRERTTACKTRSLSAEIDTLITLFPRLTVTQAMGAVIARYENRGISLSSDTINSHLYRGGKRESAVSKSWAMHNANRGGSLDSSSIAVWRSIWIERYPEEQKSILKNSI